jgi:hypothetical protein
MGVKGNMLAVWILVCMCLPSQAQDSLEKQNENWIRISAERKGKSLEAARAAKLPAEVLNAVREALSQDPLSNEAWRLAVETGGSDADARNYWLLQWARAALLPGRSTSLDPGGKALFNGDAAKLMQLTQGFGVAIDELLKLAREKERDGAQRSDSLLVAWWARRLARDLATSSPGLLAALETELEPGLSVADALPLKTIKALEGLCQQGISSSNPRLAVEAARILAGLGRQSELEDRQGPLPQGLGNLEGKAGDLLARARGLLESREEAPWTIDELLRLDGDEIEAFTRMYSSYGRPAVTHSPRNWYRVETDCGHGTLLGTAQTIELHHERLARWYGKDPFVGRQGLVRIVSEATGLESEGAPFWWVGGFQGGDTTVMRLSCPGPTIEGLGHGLTHELTHRFDGAIFPGIPAWLAEGKAVWTGGAYGDSEQMVFVDNYASTGAMIDALNKGYGGVERLRQLIRGEVDDYRDNYTAGHALYVYLRSNKGSGDKPRFRELLDGFQQRVGSAKDVVELFESLFCDGKAGRPEKLEKFAEEWGAWLVGFSWWDPKPWAKDYVGGVEGKGSPELFDEPLWGWSRNRAEPRFGQGQALLAGALLAQQGKRSEAVAAWIWALSVDGRWPKIEAELARTLDAEGRKDAAWCLRMSLNGSRGERIGAPSFANLIPKTLAQHAALAKASAEAQARGEVRTAALLRADAERLGEWLGLAELALPEGARTSFEAQELLDGPALRLGAERFEELGLTGHEERRARGQWCFDAEGDLVLGMDKPPSDKVSTGGGADAVDRGAAWRDAVAFAPEWVHAGSYRIDCRVRFLTSFIGGAVVFGYRAREDNYRLSFSAGDYAYAIGMKDKREFDFDKLNVGLSGLRDRDGGLNSGPTGAGVQFPSPRSSAWIALIVSGPQVECFVDGQFAGRYQTVDGAPIEGRVGFVASMGSVEIESPRVTRLDRARALNGAPERRFDLASDASLRPWDGVPSTSRGIPLHSQGTLLVWMPAPQVGLSAEGEAEKFERRAFKVIRDVGGYVARTLPTQPLVVAWPADLPAESSQRIDAEVERVLGEGVTRLRHRWSWREPDKDSGGGTGSYSTSAWVAFIDSFGCVRAATPLLMGKPRDAVGFERWLKVFREHGKPTRDLPELVREAPDPAKK